MSVSVSRLGSFNKQHQKIVIEYDIVHARNSFETDTLLYVYDIKIQLEKEKEKIMSNDDCRERERASPDGIPSVYCGTNI